MRKKLALLALFTIMIPFACAKSTDTKLIDLMNNNQFDKMIKLLDQGANPNALTKDGKSTALNVAVDNSNLVGAQILLDYGADVNKTNKANVSPILNIVMRNNPQDLKMAVLLLENGADIKSPLDFSYQVNPTSLAMKMNNRQMIDLFERYGNFNKCDLAFFKMQGQNVKNADHWRAIDTWKSCQLPPITNTEIGLPVQELYKQIGKPYSTVYVDKNSAILIYLNLYSKYVDNPDATLPWFAKGSSIDKKRIVNKCKEYKSYYVDNGIVVDIKNENLSTNKPISYNQPK